MLRTPRAWAPSSSDSRAIRFRSRVVQWTRHSRSRSCWIPNATAIAPIRTRAIAESLTLTTSTPASRRSRAASIVRSIRTERGGSISTDTTNRPAARSGRQAGRRRRVADARRVAGPLDDRRPRPACEIPAGTPSARRPRGRGRRRGPAPGRSLERVEDRAHRRDMGRRRAAAAADDPGPRVQQSRGHRREVVGARGVHEAALEALRQAGVRHDRARRGVRGGEAHRLERVEAGHRAGAAVDADGIHPGAGRAPRGVGGVVPSGRTSSSPKVSEARIGRSDDRRASSTAHRSPQVRVRLEDEDVDATLEQALDLLAEDRPRARPRGMAVAPWVGTPAGRPTRRRARRARPRPAPRGPPGRPAG